MRSMFHTHEPAFHGKHTHDVNGSKVEHVHTLQSAGDDDPGIEVVSAFDMRFKEPTVAPSDGAEHHVLEVENIVQDASAETS
jgi:hypothetical protein